MKKIIFLATIAGFSIPFFILVFLLKESVLAISFFGLCNFFINHLWFPLENQVGLINQIAGSLFCAILAVTFTIPSAISFVFFTEYLTAKKIQSSIWLIIEALQGIPSVIFGLWGLTKIVPLIAEKYPPGTNLLVGSIILSMMLFPGFSLGINSLLKTFNQHYEITSKSLSLPDVNYFFKIFIPANISNLMSISLFQFGKALGETMAVMMVTGNVINFPTSFFSPIRTLTSNIALEMAYASGAHRSSLYFSGFLLVVILLIITLLSFLISRDKND